ncbi:phage holin family protein [Candidatus Bipolaricaulota bacterium]|nr:phage holin family protein [Candidatus Bipolaricaulota bacterium]
MWKLLINMLALVIVVKIVPGITITSIWAGFWAALILGVVNVFIKPIFILFTLPLTVLTLGLFLFVINGVMLLIVDALVPGFAVSGLFVAIIGALLLSVISGLIESFLD